MQSQKYLEFQDRDSRALNHVQGPSSWGALCDCLSCVSVKLAPSVSGQLLDSWGPPAHAVYEGTQFTAGWALPVVYPCKIVSLKLM